MTLHPGWFGLDGAAAAVRFSFLSVAIWWLVFSIPLAIAVREPKAVAAVTRSDAWRELRNTMRAMASNKPLWMFLIAYWLYIDGVNTVIKMAVDYGGALGLPTSGLMAALLLTQFVAFPAALVYGAIGNRVGARPAILAGLIVYVGVTLWATRLDSIAAFFGMAVIVGLVQGGVQSLSRSLFGQFVPPGKSAEYFGFYNMLGKFATVLGPVLIGVTAKLTASSRSGIGSVAVLFIAGAVLLWQVRVPEPAHRAGEIKSPG